RTEIGPARAGLMRWPVDSIWQWACAWHGSSDESLISREAPGCSQPWVRRGPALRGILGTMGAEGSSPPRDPWNHGCGRGPALRGILGSMGAEGSTPPRDPWKHGWGGVQPSAGSLEAWVGRGLPVWEMLETIWRRGRPLPEMLFRKRWKRQ